MSNGPNHDDGRASGGARHDRSWRAALPAAARPVLVLVTAWSLLNLLFNVRYPAPEPPGWYLLPALDATLLLWIAALFARGMRRMPPPLVAFFAILCVAVRLYRFGDGIVERYFNRPLSLALDVPLSSELVRLLDATVPRARLLIAVPMVLAALVGIGVAVARAIRAAERGLATRAARVVLYAITALTTVASVLMPGGNDGLRMGAFGASAVARLGRDVAFVVYGADRYRRAQATYIDEQLSALRALPHGLDRLHGAPVLLFFVESYGAAIVDQPDLAQRLGPTYRAAATILDAQGFSVATGLLDSPTYAGRSWLAHQTLLTGLRTPDRIVDDLVQRTRPPSLARFFRDAGYRTVFAQPANRYRSLMRWLYDFDFVYSGWDFEYHGPPFRWANMPDQFVVDFIHRREIATARKPIFIAYALVSSHAPWSDQPAFIDDWSKIGDGTIYGSLPIDRFPISWTTLSSGGPAYAHSIEYDFRVLVDYIVHFVSGDALVIVLGDHQPVAEVTGFNSSHAVPVHIISRNRALLAPFLARGYSPGVRPTANARPIRGMETFLPDLLADFSTQQR